MSAKKIFTGIVFVVALSCSTKTIQSPGEGFITVQGGKVWYRIIGNGDKTPLLVLHGGPGFSSTYLKPLEVLGDDRPVIFYDQLGSGKSDRPHDSTLWTVARFTDELEKIRRELKLDEVHIFAHSWGTILATEYLARTPRGIKTIVFASPAISVERWLADANRLKQDLPEAVRDSLNINEKRGTTNSPGYTAATEAFYRQHVCRIPYPVEVSETFAEINMEVYGTMWGNNEFTCTGNLRSFDRSEVLKKIDVPVLFTCGAFDEATPSTTRWYASQVPHAQIAVVPDASHMTMNEKPEAYPVIIREFLNQHE
jgi:proline-specific peptidase